MLTVIPTTKEQLIYYLLNNISLGTYDRRFLDNIQKLNLMTNKPVTSNQHELLNKIVQRYSRQLTKNSLNVVDLLNLNWDIAPITSLPQYTDAFVSIEDNTIVIRCPYKKEFISDIRKNHSDLPFKWNKDLRIWTVPLSEQTLKISVESIDKHYPSINCCEHVKDILNTIDSYSSAKIWDPTLVRVGDNLMIAAINPCLDDAIKHINLDLELSTISKLQRYGIEIDDTILLELHEKLGSNDETTELLNFVVHHDVTIDISRISRLIDMLTIIKCDLVVMSEYSNSRSFGVNGELLTKLKDSGIPHVMIDRKVSKVQHDFKTYSLPVCINLGFWNKTLSSAMTHKVAKTVTLTNGAPIQIK